MKKKRFLFFISQDYSFPILRPLQEEIRRRGDEVKWFLYGDEITYEKLNKDEVRIPSIEEVISYNPHAVFVPGNVVPSFIPGLKVEVFHGLPGNKTRKDGQIYHYIIRGMFDLYCTQGPESTQKFQELAREYGYFSVVETGWCKLDPLFCYSFQKEEKKRKTIFFASTFSPRFSKARELRPFVEYMIKKYDFNWYITLHPKMNKEIVASYRMLETYEGVQFVDATQLYGAFRESDLMLCDTSSIVYEFLTQLKPVVTFQTEKEEPAIINVRQLDMLEEKILDILKNPEINYETILNSVSKIHPYRDGKSSSRVLDAVDEMLEGRLKPPQKKPLNILRNFKLRKELGYWKFFHS